MSSIISKYDTAIEEFISTIKNSSEISIDATINQLKKIESILFLYKLSFKDISYGKKYLACLKKNDEIQFRITTLENSAHKEFIAKYLTYLKKQASDLNTKIKVFNSRKKLKFPTVKIKDLISDEIFLSKSDKYLRKIEQFIATQSDDNIEDDVEDIFKSFNKFNKIVLAATYLNILDDENATVLEPTLRLLNDIIHRENLILELYSFYKKNIEQTENLIDSLEHEKMTLIDTFESEEENILNSCRMIVKRLHNNEICDDLNQIDNPIETIS
ncbi:MAG TPA: hypothetical protein P5084_04770 [Paludibacter sp.]|nr:hypothetical protein [Paludibacter sp.]